MISKLLFLFLLLGCKNSINETGYIKDSTFEANTTVDKDIVTNITIIKRTGAPIAFFSVDNVDDMSIITQSIKDVSKEVKKKIIGNELIVLNYSLNKLKIPYLIIPGDSITITFDEKLSPYISYSKYGYQDRYNVFGLMTNEMATLFSTSHLFLANPQSVNIDSLFMRNSQYLSKNIQGDSLFENYMSMCSDFVKSQYYLQKNQIGDSIADSSFMSNEENVKFPEFRQLISYNHYYKSSRHSKVETVIMQEYYASALLEKGEIRNYLLFYAMVWMRNKNKQLFEKYKTSFIKNCSNRNYISEIIPDINISEKSGIGEFFAYHDSSRISLNDIVEKCKGKIIYIDLWASWCAPCRAAMDGSKNLHEKYKGRDICFVYASIDDKVLAWKKAVKEEGLEKIDDNFLVINQKESFFVKKFKVNTIPRYIIFDKSGKLVDDNAPSPDSEEINILLDKLLKENK